MSHHTPVSLSVESQKGGSETDTFSKIHSSIEKKVLNDATTFAYHEKSGTEVPESRIFLENGELNETDNSSTNGDGKKIIPNSNCLDDLKFDSLVRDKDKIESLGQGLDSERAISFRKCNGISHSDHKCGDNKRFHLKTCCEEMSPIGGGCNSHSDTVISTESDKHSKQTHPTIGNIDSVEELQLNDKHMPSSETNFSEVDVLLSEIERTSLYNSTNLNENNSDSNEITYEVYESERQMPDIMRLITKDLSEPYSIYTYRYFIHNWPKLCFLAKANNVCVGAIVCKLDLHKKMVRRGYIAMLAVDSEFRRKKIVSKVSKQ
ncbi:N-alpha-acetyltransferase 30 [Bulinus truncatus]|nr:N-alpha-acetyltransferase 30 [Bulinus truncatus]